MNKIELKKDIFIEGFDDIDLWNKKLCYLGQISEKNIKIIYQGKTSEITRDDVEDYIIANKGAYLLFYRNYKDGFPLFRTIQKSIQSACNKDYCIIYKTNVNE